MMEIVNKQIEKYAFDHSKSETALLKEVREFTMTQTQSSQMLSGPLEGNFLKMVVQLTGTKRILELGTFTGYSALWMAQGLEKDGEIITCDTNPGHADIARCFFDKSPYAHQIHIKLGKGLDTIAKLEAKKMIFDVVFIDADKSNYPEYYERCLHLVRSGGSILIDNTLWSGEVLDPKDTSTRAIHKLNETIVNDDRVDNVLITIRDGIQWVKKK